jgi:hypothetical protein
MPILNPMVFNRGLRIISNLHDFLSDREGFFDGKHFDQLAHLQVPAKLNLKILKINSKLSRKAFGSIETVNELKLI